MLTRVISDKLSQALDNCSEWLIDNKLSLHLGKTESILFGPKQKLKNGVDFSIKCNGHTVDSSEKVKYFGVHIDNFLNREFIVESIVKKVNDRLRFLYRQGRFLNVKASAHSFKQFTSRLLKSTFSLSLSLSLSLYAPI